MAIMVDLNQGWRMAGDTSRSLDPVAAREIAARLADDGVLWVEEPLAGTDLRGLAALRASGLGIRVAGGEMTRTLPELLAAVEADAFDVHQPDVVLTGLSHARTVGELALARNRWFTPHTWTNGIGLLANLHVAAGRRVAARSSSSRTTHPAGPRSGATSCSREPIRPGPDGILRVPRGARARRRPRRGRRQAIRRMTTPARSQSARDRRSRQGYTPRFDEHEPSGRGIQGWLR